MAALPLERDVPLLEREALLRVLAAALERVGFAPDFEAVDFEAVDFAFGLDLAPLAEVPLR